jgi:PAS domain S-box-containing protein
MVAGAAAGGTPPEGRTGRMDDGQRRGPPGTAAMARELAALREEVRALRKSEEKYRSVFDALPVSLQVVNEAGLVTEVNPYHLEHIGKGKVSRDEHLNTYIATRRSIVGAGLSERFRSVLAGRSIDEKEVYFPTTTGGEHAYYNVKGVPIRAEGQSLGAVFIVEDVTELKEARDELLRHQRHLEDLVEARITDLKEAYVRLQEEYRERARAEAESLRLVGELQAALAKVRTLSGFIPICASCKKIRDDKGFWSQIETYLREHSEAEFTHSICPECVRRLYPGLGERRGAG